METVQPLFSPRLALRPFTADDRPAMLALLRHPDVTRYYGSGHPLSDAQIDIVLDSHIHCRPKGYWAWAVTLTGDPACRGQVTAMCNDWWHEEWIELCWLLVPAMWGQGYATEAVKAIMHHGVHEIGWRKIMAGADVRNTQSERVMVKNGMHFAREELDPHGKMRRVCTLLA